MNPLQLKTLKYIIYIWIVLYLYITLVRSNTYLYRLYIPTIYYLLVPIFNLTLTECYNWHIVQFETIKIIIDLEKI